MTHSIYAERRARVAAQLGKDGIAVIPTAPERTRNRDSDFLYRHDSYFYYLSGFTEPNAWLVIGGDGKTTLFCAPKDLQREIWDGYRLGPEAAPAALGVDAAHSVAELDSELPKLVENRAAVWFPFATHEGLELRVSGWLNQVRARVRYGALCPEQQRDLCAIVDEMRLIKDAREQDIMRRASQISARGHVRAMELAARMLREGRDVREYHLDAELLQEFRFGGSQYSAYSSIVAAGANACVLHYRSDSAPVRAGELVLIDAGCELDSYASDITRTFPANGKFSGLRSGAGFAGSGDCRDAGRRAFHGSARRRGEGAGAGHAGSRPAGSRQSRRDRGRDRKARLFPVLHAPHRPLARDGRA
jgi:Xaa-Pro aminopeptidase